MSTLRDTVMSENTNSPENKKKHIFIVSRHVYMIIIFQIATLSWKNKAILLNLTQKKEKIG